MANKTYTNIRTLNRVYNLVKKDVKMDGSDESALLQAAIDEVSADGGGTIEIPAGILGIGTTVSIKSNIRLRGKGKGVTFIEPTSALSINDPVIKNQNSGSIGAGVRTDYNIHFEHITFNGENRVYPAYDQNTNPPTYGGLTQGNSRGHFIRLYAVSGYSVINCEFENHASVAPLIDGGCKNGLVAFNDFHDNGKIDDVSPCIWAAYHPVYPDDTLTDGLIVCNNHFHDCNRMGMTCAVGSAEISNNVFEDMREGGIHVRDGALVVIQGNIFRNMTTSDIVCNGVEVESEDALTDGRIIISKNIFENLGTRGISLNGTLNFVVTDNIFRNCGTDTVYPTPNGPLNYAAGRSAGDPIDATKRCGIGINVSDTYGVKKGVISGNVITSDGVITQYGIVFAATGTPLEKVENVIIKDNIISGMALDQYYITAGVMGDNVVVEDYLDSNGKRLGEILELSDGHVVTGSAVITSVGGNAAKVVSLDAASTEDWQWEVKYPEGTPQGRVLAGLRVLGQKAVSGTAGNIVLQVGTVLRYIGLNALGAGALTTQNYTVAVLGVGSSSIEQNDLMLTIPLTFPEGTILTLRLSRLGADAADSYTSDYYLISVQPIWQ